MRTFTSAFAGALGALTWAASPLAGQQDDAAACAPPTAAASDSSAIPVVIVAQVHADAVVFQTDPDVRVTVNGCEPLAGQLVTTSNLPDTIVPGVRYTNVEIRSEYRATLTLECRAPEDIVVRLCEELLRRD